MWIFLRRTMVTGIVVLLPVFFLAYLVFKLFSSIRAVAGPVIEILPIDRILGLVLLNIVAVLIVLALCLVAGLLARIEFISRKVERFDKTMSNRVPGYSIAKGALSGVLKEDIGIEDFKPVVVKSGRGLKVGFEVDRLPSGMVVVFLPNAPNPQLGTVVMFTADEVISTNLSRHKIVECMQFYGKGLAGEIKKNEFASNKPND
ncbi:MAG: hypothetical protein JXR14_05230 [Paracoccaceae bacterium]